MIQPSGDGFWATVELLVNGITDVNRANPTEDDIEDWLDTVTNKAKLQREKLKRFDNNYSDTDAESEHYTLIDCSFSDPPVRSRLGKLMGSNVVRLTDRKYMLRLAARIQQEYETRQQSRIEERKKNELMRTKTMILNRLISVHEAPKEIRQYPLFQLYLYCDAIVEQKRKKYTTKQRKVAASLYHMLYPNQKNQDKTDTEDEEIYMKRIYVDGVPELVPMTNDEIQAAKREIDAVKDIEEGYMLTKREYDKLHYETEAIKDLRETQKVEEMYAKAHDILGILYSYVDDGRYKKKLTQEKIIDASDELNEPQHHHQGQEHHHSNGNNVDNTNGEKLMK